MFDDLIGHAAQRRALADALLRWREGRGPLHHAHLVAGEEEYPRGARDGPWRPLGHGQWRLVVQLGAAIVAAGDDRSEAYRKALNGTHPDLNLVEREGEVIRREQVDRLVQELSLRPFVAAHRVWILDEADSLHAAAANKLLKSLEEPPEHVHFLLATARLERVLPTVLSRCQLIQLGPVDRDELVRHLARHGGLPQSSAEALATLAAGSVTRAERLAEEERSGHRGDLVAQSLRAVHGEREAQEAVMAALERRCARLRGEIDDHLRAELARIAADVPDERDRKWRERQATERAKRDALRLARREVLDTADGILALLRDLWVVSGGVSEVLWNGDHAAAIQAAACASPAAYQRMLVMATAVRKQLYANVDPALALRAQFARFEEVARTCAE